MKIFLDMVGCRLNQAEIETLANQFRTAGHEIVPGAEGADLVVVNTCTVTSQAAADSRQKIRQAARLGVKQVVVTGCWATLEPDAAASFPAVSQVIPNERKDGLVADVLGAPFKLFDLEPLARRPLPGLRARTRAFIKVQDGCDNACTFCITTVARGASRSRTMETVLRDIHSALAGGTREIVLTGVHLGSWGSEFGLHLRHLVAGILKNMDVPRLRLSSLEPWDLDDHFFSLWQDSRLMPHFHLPLQSGSRSVLRRMGRKTDPDEYRELLAAARAAIPDVAITTDIMAGFPGETDAEFAETMIFVREMEFAGGHVFPYSARPGTAAARMPGQVQHEVRKERSARLREEFAEMARVYRQRFVGQSLSVLWESATQSGNGAWLVEGLSSNYLRVSAQADVPRWNQIDQVAVNDVVGEGVKGKIFFPE